MMRVLLILLLFAGTCGLSARDAAAAREAVCIVCQVKEGATGLEPVKALRMHDGHEYAFCSEKCAKRFDADPAAYVPAGFPRAAPPFVLRDLDGNDVSLSALRGQVVLLDFWATWCAPCRKSMPELDALHRRFRERGVTVLGVSIDEGGPEKVRRFLRNRKVSYPIAVDSGTGPAWEAFHVKAVPAAFLLDREGRIVAQWTGRPADPATVEVKLGELLARE